MCWVIRDDKLLKRYTRIHNCKATPEIAMQIMWSLIQFKNISCILFYLFGVHCSRTYCINIIS